MIWIETIAGALGFLLKGLFIIVLLGIAGMIVIILRELAWYLREENKKKLKKEKENENTDI